MQELVINEGINIENLIYEIRGKQVMLDSDLAKLYQVETKRINEAVKNNIDKFPERFCFRISESEYRFLKSKFSTSNLKGGSRKGHNVFTEQGVAMLSTILKSKIAIEVSINIMDAFVQLRKYASSGLIQQKYINELVIEDNKRINLLEESFSKLENKKVINEIYFNGQIYDAYSKLIDIMSVAENELTIIDSYADKSVLDMISKINKKVLLITKNNNLLKEIDIKKYNEEYHNLEIKYDNSFHDRYIILDKKEVYHCGTSLNHAGSKTFSINKIEDEFVINALINKILK